MRRPSLNFIESIGRNSSPMSESIRQADHVVETRDRAALAAKRRRRPGSPAGDPWVGRS
jgi:hypothetical protein